MENASKALIIAGAILIAILLITIVVVLINSGKDTTGTGSSSGIQAFNSQFVEYEGEISGTQVKSLIQQVRVSNVNDKSHQVYVFYGTNEWRKTTYKAEGKLNNERLTSIQQIIVDSKKYQVSFHYKNKNDDIATLVHDFLRGTAAADTYNQELTRQTLEKIEEGYICIIEIYEEFQSN